MAHTHLFRKPYAPWFWVLTISGEDKAGGRHRQPGRGTFISCIAKLGPQLTLCVLCALLYSSQVRAPVRYTRACYGECGMLLVRLHVQLRTQNVGSFQAGMRAACTHNRMARLCRQCSLSTKPQVPVPSQAHWQAFQATSTHAHNVLATVVYCRCTSTTTPTSSSACSPSGRATSTATRRRWTSIPSDPATTRQTANKSSQRTDMARDNV